MPSKRPILVGFWVENLYLVLTLVNFPADYNCIMRIKNFFLWFMTIVFFVVLLRLEEPSRSAWASSRFSQSSNVSPYELIVAMNTLRVSQGLPALIEDPIINAVAQATAETMAASQMSWHIGNVRGRVAAAGYGGGATVWATENFAVGYMTIDEIMVAWSDPDHMRPAVNPAYCHVGAGVAKASNGRYYYILQAAYISGQSCGEYVPPEGSPPQSGSIGVPQVIVPVKIAMPDADGRVYHVVEAGQSFWAIAIAYQITIRDLEIWNNLSRNAALQPGQKLFIPDENTEGYATPTPVGMIVPSTPDVDGKIIHVVQPYQSLIPIGDAYGVAVNTILALNGILEDWPLQIGQKLLIFPGNITPSPTPRPLTPIEKLTPASDGNYYHTVNSGETLSWIADLYDIALADLTAWNGLTSASIIRPNQNLILQVTPPATATHTPGPPTVSPKVGMQTSTPSVVMRTLPATTVVIPLTESAASAGSSFLQDGIGIGLTVLAVLVIAGLLLWVGIFRKAPNDDK